MRQHLVDDAILMHCTAWFKAKYSCIAQRAHLPYYPDMQIEDYKHVKHLMLVHHLQQSQHHLQTQMLRADSESVPAYQS